MSITYRFAAVAVLLTTTLIVSCSKREVDKDTQSSVDFGVAEAGYSGVLPVVNQIGIDEDGLNKASTCATITYLNPQDTVGNNNWPITIEVDFGTGCIDHDGKLKQGKIVAVFHDRFSNQGAQVDVSLSNFKVNGIEYRGSLTLKNNGNRNYSSTVADGQCIGDNWNIQYTGTSTLTWLAGHTTPSDPNDDMFEYTNNSNCVNREGRTFDVVTITPLLKTDACEYITQGVVEITPEGLATRSFDFGDGSCDDEATITVNGNTFVVNLN